MKGIYFSAIGDNAIKKTRNASDTEKPVAANGWAASN